MTSLPFKEAITSQITSALLSPRADPNCSRNGQKRNGRRRESRDEVGIHAAIPSAPLCQTGSIKKCFQKPVLGGCCGITVTSGGDSLLPRDQFLGFRESTFLRKDEPHDGFTMIHFVYSTARGVAEQASLFNSDVNSRGRLIIDDLMRRGEIHPGRGWNVRPSLL
ncbi:hypothetical protein DPEC_G00160700 [Dallia pectoralis]|uniref:Uncharacterized protein n=1 Tax=Dallia pectoralis TaxID=75939 RepID=A0ACC2GG71_DALPE|nr:hypothetical protein DPEC_G00160700 [Dallia pectoralis]